MITWMSFRNKVVKPGEVDTDVTIKKLSKNSIALNLTGSINIYSRYYINLRSKQKCIGISTRMTK